MDKNTAHSFLNESASLYTLFQNMTESIGVHELVYQHGEAVDYRITDVNPSFERVTGFSRDVAVGAVASELYGTGEAPFLNIYRTVVETGEPNQFQVFWPTTERHFQISAISLEKGMFATLLFDISELKHNEANIQASEKKYRDLFMKLPVGLFRSTIGTGRVLECNEYFAETLGYPDVPTCIDEFHSERHLVSTEIREWRNTVIKQRSEVKDLGMSLKRNDGHQIWVSFSARVHPDQGYIEGAVIETTKLKQLQDRIQQSEKLAAIGQLAGGMAHDFNNQLAGIVGFADLILGQVDQNSKIAAYANNILISANRATDLNSQVLAFARRGKYLAVPVDIHQLIQEVMTLLRHTVDRRIVFKQQIELSDPYVIGDPSQLQNALMNLALNARDALPDGGEISFSTQTVYLDTEYCKKSAWEIAEGDYLRICVTDNGVGMDKETQNHMFEPFFTTKEHGKGTGMGLAAVYGTVQNHNGTIDTYSEPNKGTTVSIYLPHAQYQSRSTIPPGETVSTDATGTGLNILVVDDEPLVAALAEEMIKKLGHHPHVIRNGREALEYYRQVGTSIDLVILDMVMPELNGRDTYKGLRGINPNVKVLLSSGYSIDGEAQEILNEGVLGFIQKPFRLKELAQKITDTLCGEPVSGDGAISPPT